MCKRERCQKKKKKGKDGPFPFSHLDPTISITTYNIVSLRK
jgi:hypothetical protein